MRKENTFRYILRLAGTLLAICAVMAGMLAVVNYITKDAIAANKEAKTQQAMELILPGVEDLAPVALEEDTGLVTAVWRSGDSWAVQTQPGGFGGAITLMVGIADGKVTGISVVSHAETPSLGAEAAASSAKGQSFRDQFVGAQEAVVGGNIDAMSGATITSKAVAEGVNAALDYVRAQG